eukprot:TRINITY_DN57959_c0_g1_i1.p1 TRINITY_DN57959_c0_g1~~TRINITY_DN57959_c0_g1_i1.p1  ORF type:complete len:274 (+),score=98.95 TRINITY_DN57959_c0_g1_i1:51-872(+)
MTSYGGRQAVEAAFNKGFTRLVYVTACYPNEEAMLAVMMALQESGVVDIVEVGVPFTDPVADGPVIERCALDAIAGGCTSIWKVINTVQKARDRGFTLPIMLMGYFNSFLDGWMDKAQGLISGAILVDLPYEEPMTHRTIKAMHDHDLTFVPIATYTTTGDRLANLSRITDTFLYCMSSSGVTGVREGLDSYLRTGYRPVWEQLCAAAGDKRKIIGFGISNSSAVMAVKELGADGLVVGSALMKTIAANKDKPHEELCAAVKSFITDLFAGSQ